MVKVSIDATQYEFPEGISILDAARSIGVEIPTLCNDDRLKPAGACRLCLVKIDGESHEAASCMRKVADGMSVTAHSPELEHNRAINLRMLAKDYPADAFIRFPDKRFHKLARQYGLTDSDFSAATNGHLKDDSHAFISVDMSRCIDCYRCVRICDELQGQFVWQVIGRGEESQIVPDSFGAFGSSTCVSCGACADTCPTGALEDKSFVQYGNAEKWTRTTCPYCGTGCEMNVGTIGDRIVQVKPVPDAPVNHGHLCVKGRYGFEYNASKDRVTEPMIRVDGEWQTVSWDEAIAFTANKIKQLVADHGKESIAVLGSARATNEENYVAQKFTRVVLGTNNVDCCARVCHTPTAAAMKMMLGTGAATNSFADIEKTRTFLLCGANPTENHPIPGARIKHAVLKGANLIVIDPRKTELTEYASIHLQLHPGTNIPLLNSIAHAIIDEGLCDVEFTDDRVSEFEEFREFVKDFSPESVADICGVPAEDIRRAARMYATAKPAMCMHGLGVTEHTQGTEGVMCLVNLALITGNIGKPGTGINPLRGQNNVQGSAQMGCDPGILTGSIAVAEGKEHFEAVWGAEVPLDKGLNQLQMIDAAREGKLKALWSIGYDVFLTNANAHETAKGFENLELCIVQDLFLNETAKRYAHVFLPASSSFEKDGTFMNAERRVQRVRKAVEAPGSARTDWEIVCDVAKAMGKGEYFDFRDAEEIWNEIRLVWPNSYGITYERIADRGLQWNCPTTDHPGSDVLHSESFATSKQAALRRIPFRPTKERVDEDFPLLLNTGRSLYHFNAGTMTQRTDLMKIRPSDMIDISREDAEGLGLENGETVRIRSKFGEALLPVNITENVRHGELFATFHDPEILLNNITSPRRDRYVQAPEYKVTAVRIEKLNGDQSAIDDVR